MNRLTISFNDCMYKDFKCFVNGHEVKVCGVDIRIRGREFPTAALLIELDDLTYDGWVEKLGLGDGFEILEAELYASKSQEERQQMGDLRAEDGGDQEPPYDEEEG